MLRLVAEAPSSCRSSQHQEKAQQNGPVTPNGAVAVVRKKKSKSLGPRHVTQTSLESTTYSATERSTLKLARNPKKHKDCDGRVKDTVVGHGTGH